MHKWLFIILIAVASQSHAQQYYFQHWDASNGLDVSDINAITQDEKGYLWIATEGNGLVRFDGANFTNLTRNDGLPSDFVSALLWDNGKLWIGTEKGLCHYNGQEITVLDSLENASKSRVKSIHKWDEQILITHKHGLSLLKNFKIEKVKEAFFVNQEIYHVSVYNNTSFITCDSGLVKWNASNFDIINPTDSIQFYWRGQGNDMASAFNANSIIHYADKEIILPLKFKSVEVSSDGSFFLGYNNGFVSCKAGVIKTYNQKNGLNASNIKDIYLDQFGTLWIGASNGLYKFVNPYVSALDENDGLRNTHIYSVLEEEDRIWLGTNNGVEVWQSDTCHSYEPLKRGVIFEIIKDEKGKKWFATENGLFTLTKKSLVNVGQSLNLNLDFVFDIEENNSGGVFVASAETAYLINGNQAIDLLQKDKSPFKGTSLISGSPEGGVWIYKIDGTLAYSKNNSLEYFENLGDLNIANYRINDLKALGGDSLLVTTAENGLILYFENQSQIINETNGLHSSKTLGVEKINHSSLAVLFSDGIQFVQLNPEIEPLEFIGKTNGFLGEEGVTHSMSLSKNNKLWLGTKTTAVGIDFNPLVEQNMVTIPFVNRIDLFFNPNTSWGDLNIETEAWLGTPKELKLNHDENYLTFHFGALARNPELINFRYKLTGQDEQWTFPGERKEAIFTSISPGKFTFTLEASNFVDFRDAIAYSIPVTIIPPFWKTYWFWLITIIVLAAFVTWLVRMRINQLNVKLQLEAALAESERKALRLQMNPHFIFNALDSISGFIFKNEPKMAVKYLSSFAKLMRLTLETSRETLIPLATEINLLKNYLEIEKLRFSNSFDYTLTVDDELDEYEIMLSPMLIQPNIENALLHGIRPLETQGNISVHFEEKDNDLVCKITDNGVGREKAKALRAKQTGKHKGLATDITSERVKLLSQTMGKKFSFRIIDLFDSQGKPSGTTVLIRMPMITDDSFD